MSAAFTPGPWRAEAKKVGQFDIVAGPDYFSRTFVAFAGCGEDIPSEANANLIASAPELYEWLEAAVDEREQEHGSLPDGAPHWSVRARAVLARARGDQ